MSVIEKPGKIPPSPPSLSKNEMLGNKWVFRNKSWNKNNKMKKSDLSHSLVISAVYIQPPFFNQVLFASPCLDWRRGKKLAEKNILNEKRYSPSSLFSIDYWTSLAVQTAAVDTGVDTKTQAQVLPLTGLPPSPPSSTPQSFLLSRICFLREFELRQGKTP